MFKVSSFQGQCDNEHSKFHLGLVRIISSEVWNLFAAKLGMVIHQHMLECLYIYKKKWVALLKVKVTVGAYNYDQHMSVSIVT